MPLIQIWVNGDAAENVAGLAAKLETTLNENEKFRGFMVNTDESLKQEIEKYAVDWKLEKAGLCYLSISAKSQISNAYKLGSAKNVVVISDKKKVIASFENVPAGEFDKIAQQLKDTTK